MGQIEPGDREEMLLAGILNGDTETNIEPADRKERLLKAILENGGKTYYRHNIRVYNTGQSGKARAVVITTDSETYTITTFAKWLVDNGYTAMGNLSYVASGELADGKTVSGIFAQSNTMFVSYYDGSGADQSSTSVDTVDDYVTEI